VTPAHPLVSVVIVSRNRPALLKRALKSVFEQDYRPLEIVLVDNRSEPPLSPPTAPDDVKVVMTRTTAPLNASSARNAGIDLASGAYVTFLDDDDYYLPGKITKQACACLDCPDAEFCVIDSEHHEAGSAARCGISDMERLDLVLLYRPIHTNCLFIRTDILRKERFNDKLDKYTDVHLTYRLFEKYKGVKAEGVGCVWDMRNACDQITNTHFITKLRDARRNQRNWKILCDDFAHLINPHPALRKMYYGKQAALSVLTVKPVDAIHYSLAALGLTDNKHTPYSA